MINSLRKIITTILTFTFGKIQWTSPKWLDFIYAKIKHSPARASIILIFVLASAYGLHWYSNLPEPIYITAHIQTPKLKSIKDSEDISPLIIKFGTEENNFIRKSVAPLSQIGKKVSGVELSPSLPGEWIWSNDSELKFLPEKNWPAGQEYNVSFDKKMFSVNAVLKQYEYAFKTHPFKASLTSFKFYQDPTHPKSHYAIATLKFNYPVDTNSLVKGTTLEFQNGTPVKFKYTYNENKRIAYLSSEQLEIKDLSQFLIIRIANTVSASTHTSTIHDDFSQSLYIPDNSTFLKVISSTASVIRDLDNHPKQIINIETSIGVNENSMNAAVKAYLLPENKPKTINSPEELNYHWHNQGEITNQVLNQSTPVKLTPIPASHNFSSLHSFQFDAPSHRYVYLTVEKGLSGLGDFKLSVPYSTIIEVPEYPKEISFLHQGSLLSLGGEQRISVLVRGLHAVKFDFARVLPDSINQLITQTEGNFNNPQFFNPSFNQNNISEIFTETRQFSDANLAKQQYTALDISKYLSTKANSTGPKGLFLLKAAGLNLKENTLLDTKASKLILVTNLGMIVKDNLDGTHNVFVASIDKGVPSANAEITVLGKNGLPLITKTSDSDGHVLFPSMKDFIDDREPIAYIAKLGEDISFIPYNNYSRQLNFSKFDVGGIYQYPNDNQENLSAFVFSDRGIYRPSDTVHIGVIVKGPYIKSAPNRLPIQVNIVDPRGVTVQENKISLSKEGFITYDFVTTDSSPTGQYNINVYLIKDNVSPSLIGTSQFKVSEFQPDKLRIKSNFTPIPSSGWTKPADLHAQINLMNLYGAPAADRKITAKMVLSPTTIDFEDYPDFIFYDPLTKSSKSVKTYTEELPNATTDENGNVDFDLNLSRFEQATYELTFYAEGFEALSGRSVSTQGHVFVSPLPFFIGYKSGDDLTFLKKNSISKVQLIAIDPSLNLISVNNLKLQLVSHQPISTLVKNSNGTFKYQSIIRHKIIKTEPYSLDKNTKELILPTQEIGNYSLKILNGDGTTLNQIEFKVVGEGQQLHSKNAELEIKLNKSIYKPDDLIEMQITSPYTGYGLITIERDKVYSYKWFKTDATNSLQSIQIPPDLKGNGYVNVSFMRDFNSNEIFINPLSFGVLPFTIKDENDKISIGLKTPHQIKPGETLDISYHLNKPAKILVFAVDEGILQVANYTLPDPLEFFFQKRALQVLTQQTVDLILPKYISEREISSTGGDDGVALLAANLNPFKRKVDLPVVFWSGLIDANTEEHHLTYEVPDYFNGTLRTMAVVISESSAGTQETKTQIKGDFVINPNIPTFVAPGDIFEISASIANNLKNNSNNEQISESLEVSDNLIIVGEPVQHVDIKEQQESVVTYRLRAKDMLGNASITFKINKGQQSSQMKTNLSIRPASSYTSELSIGSTSNKIFSFPLLQKFYHEFYDATATISRSPLVMINGLSQYLEKYPYGCTEQVTSRALPLLAMQANPELFSDTAMIHDKINHTFQELNQRQMTNGGFNYWPGANENEGDKFISVYAIQFLTIAKFQGNMVPTEMYQNSINYLKNIASQTPSNLTEARVIAFAIYVLTQNEIVTTNYITNVLNYLQANTNENWKKDITGSYIAASFKLLKNDADADKLINQFDPDSLKTDYVDFYNDSFEKAQYLYIVSKEFPALFPSKNAKFLSGLIAKINNNDNNTLISGEISLALGSFPKTDNHDELTISTLMNLPESKLFINDKHINLNLENNLKSLTFNNPSSKPFYYQILQSGFMTTPQSKSVSDGIEVFREYRNHEGDNPTNISIGDEIEVHIHIRSLNDEYISNIVIEDLLPGGFEIVNESVNLSSAEYIDIREDRVNFFTSVEDRDKEIVYKIKATNAGDYQVPGIYAQSMYNPQIKAIGASSRIIVK